VYILQEIHNNSEEIIHYLLEKKTV
jgi:hypothetical protein